MVVWLAPLLVLALGAADVAVAHPVGDRAAAQTTMLEVHRDRVDLDYQVDVPTILVQTARTGGDPVAAMATELESGLLLVVDGQVVSMTERAPSPAPSVGSHSVGFVVHLQAALPQGAHHVEVQTGNLQEATNFYSGDVHLDDGLPIEACSLLTLDHGRIVRDDTLRWRRGEENRTLSVDLVAPRPTWWTWVSPTRADPVPARTALVPRPADLVDRERLTPGIWLATAAVAMALGAASGRANVVAVGIALCGVGLGVVPHGPALGVAVAAIAALTRRPTWVVTGACAAALVATVVPVRAELWLGVAFAAGSLATSGPTRRIRWVAISAAALTALVRAS